MLLGEQVQAILYHFLMGWIYGCTFSFLCSLTVHLRFALLKSCLEILYHICFTMLAFYGLYRINGGVTTLYLIGFFLMGVFIYYRWYLPVFLSPFAWFWRLLRPIWKKITLAKKKILGIIKVRRKQRQVKRTQRRAAHGGRKKKRGKQTETKAISTDEEIH